MTFLQVQTRILARLRDKVNNGEVSERGFARAAGISQPHINKVLKGTRSLSFDRFDLILQTLKCSLLDVFTEAELRQQLTKLVAATPLLHIPFLERPIGPGGEWDPRIRKDDFCGIPCSAVDNGHHLVAARLRPDPAMFYAQAGFNVAAVDFTRISPPYDPDSLYLVCQGDQAWDEQAQDNQSQDNQATLRRVRQGARHLYLLADPAADNPQQWQRMPTGARSAILGLVVWLGREEEGSHPSVEKPLLPDRWRELHGRSAPN